MGAPRAIALCHCFGGALDFQSGRWDEAEVALRKAVTLYGEVGSASGESFSLQRLGVLLTARGRLDEAREFLEEGIVVAERAAMRSHCLTRLHASMLRNRIASGVMADIRMSLAEGLEAAQRHGDCVTCNALLLPEVVRASLAVEDVEAAERHAADLERTAGEFDSRAWTAMAQLARGRVLLAQHRYDDGLEALTTAGTTFAEIDQAYEAARAACLQAECLRGRAGPGDEAQANVLKAGADAQFEALGAGGLEV